MHISELSGPLASRLLKVAADHSFVAITVTRSADQDAPGEIIYVNDAFENLTGYEREEVVGKTPGVLQGPGTEQDVIDRLDRRLEAGKVFHGKATNYRKGGEPFTMEWKVTPLAVQEDDAGSSGEAGTYHVAVQREAPST